MTAPDAEHPCPRHLSIWTIVGIFFTGALAGWLANFWIPT